MRRRVSRRRSFARGHWGTRGAVPRSIVIALAAALLLAAAPVASAAAPRTSKVRCTGDPAVVKQLDVAVAGEQAWGLYALPATQP